MKDLLNFFVQKRLKVCYAIRINCQKELVATWHIDGITIVGVSFRSFKRNQEKDNGDSYDTKPKLCNQISK